MKVVFDWEVRQYEKGWFFSWDIDGVKRPDDNEKYIYEQMNAEALVYWGIW